MLTEYVLECDNPNVNKEVWRGLWIEAVEKHLHFQTKH
jgi:hypothetical protein